AQILRNARLLAVRVAGDLADLEPEEPVELVPLALEARRPRVERTSHAVEQDVRGIGQAHRRVLLVRSKHLLPRRVKRREPAVPATRVPLILRNMECNEDAHGGTASLS